MEKETGAGSNKRDKRDRNSGCCYHRGRTRRNLWGPCCCGAGARVLVLEQQPRDKQFILGIGEIGHINSQWQKRHGVPTVNVEEFVQDWQRRTNNRSDYRLIRTYAEKCGECFDWFIQPLSQEEQDKIHPMLTPQSPNFPDTLNGLRAYSGAANMGIALQNKAVKANQRLAEQQGARFLFGVKACQLVKEGGRVTGVVAQKQTELIFCARQRKAYCWQQGIIVGIKKCAGSFWQRPVI